MRTLPAALAMLGIGIAMPLALSAQVPQIPATFYGAVTVDGEAPPAGTEVRGLIDGVDCTQPGAASTIDAGKVGAYVISVMHESQQPGCAVEGELVTFTIGGRPAGQTATWQVGPHELSLNAGAGSPQPLPSNVAIPTARTTTPTPGGPQPTDDTDVLPTQGSATPRPPGAASSGGDGDDGPPVWGILVVALMGLGVLGGAAGFALSRRGTAEGPIGVEDGPQNPPEDPDSKKREPDAD